MKELWGEHYFMEQISPEVRKAQLLAEREQMSEYRRLRLQAYKDWADDMKREARKALYRQEEAECRGKLKDIPADQVAVRTQTSPLNVIKLKMVEPKKKETLLQRIVKWFRDIRA